MSYMEGKGEEKRNQGGKLVAKRKSGSEERLFGFSSNYKTSPAPRWEGSSELPVIALPDSSVHKGQPGHRKTQAQPNARHLFGSKSHLLI